MITANDLLKQLIEGEVLPSKLCQIAFIISIRQKDKEKQKLYQKELRGYLEEDELSPFRERYKNEDCSRSSIIALEKLGTSEEALNIISALMEDIISWLTGLQGNILMVDSKKMEAIYGKGPEKINRDDL